MYHGGILGSCFAARKWIACACEFCTHTHVHKQQGNNFIVTTDAGVTILEAGTRATGSLRSLTRAANWAGAGGVAVNLQNGAANVSGFSGFMTTTSQRVGRLAAGAGVGLDAYNALTSASDFQSWNGYVGDAQSRIDDVALVWQRQRLRGMLDNPVTNGLGVAFNPVSNLVGSAENVMTIRNTANRTIEIRQMIREAPALRLQSLDSMIQQQSLYAQGNGVWLRNAPVGELQEAMQHLGSAVITRLGRIGLLQQEGNRWWWNRSASWAELSAEIARNQRLIQMFQSRIAEIYAEIQLRGGQ